MIPPVPSLTQKKTKCHIFGRNANAHVRTVQLPESALGYKRNAWSLAKKSARNVSKTKLTHSPLSRHSRRKPHVTEMLTPSTRPCAANCTQQSYHRTWVAGHYSFFTHHRNSSLPHDRFCFHLLFFESRAKSSCNTLGQDGTWKWLNKKIITSLRNTSG